MKKTAKAYALGDRIVHQTYGVGEIEDIETRTLNGEALECFRVQTRNGEYWFPTELLANPRIHPVPAKDLIDQAIEILKTPSTELDTDPAVWQKRIEEVQKKWDVVETTTLVRDLAGLKGKQRLSQMQDKALNILGERLLKDWSAAVGVDVKTLRNTLKVYLKESAEAA